jgi:hypothetical protein
MFLWPVDEVHFQFVQIGWLVNEVVEVIGGGNILDVIHNCAKNIMTKKSRSQLLVKSLKVAPTAQSF